MNQKVSLFPTITAAIKSSPKDVWWIVCLDYTDVQGNLYRKESMKKKDRLKYNSAGTIYYDWIHSSQRSAMYVLVCTTKEGEQNRTGLGQKACSRWRFLGNLHLRSL